jgi:digeranylgeranylglycerophospholipid reductase
MKYDIVVVGGRIGGSTASIFASKNGADVLMLEKNQEIGTPVQCAEATSSRTFKTLKWNPLLSTFVLKLKEPMYRP